MSTEVNSEVTPHEQEMMDLVDRRQAEAAGQADPENAPEYKEPEGQGEEFVRDPSLPDKFKSVEDMAKAYRELEARFTKEQQGIGIKEPEVTEPKEPVGSEDNSNVPKGLTNEAMNKFTDEYNKNGGLSEASYNELQKLGVSKEVVNNYIAGQNAVMEAQANQAYQVAGGKENYSQMIEWAKNNWSENQINAFNTAVNSGNQDTVMFGVNGLVAQYKQANGSPIPKRAITGDTSGTSNASNRYSDKGEMYKAMRNPLYGKDASYTKSVETKIANSSF